MQSELTCATSRLTFAEHRRSTNSLYESDRHEMVTIRKFNEHRNGNTLHHKSVGSSSCIKCVMRTSDEWMSLTTTTAATPFHTSECERRRPHGKYCAQHTAQSVYRAHHHKRMIDAPTVTWTWNQLMLCVVFHLQSPHLPHASVSLSVTVECALCTVHTLAI